MTNFSFDQLVDLTQVRQLLETHHTLSGMAYSVRNTDGKTLITVGWQDICARFHRSNPVSLMRCHESAEFIKTHLHSVQENGIEYRCKNGLMDSALPIVIDGEHLATFIIGQFFYDDSRPETGFFRTQAETLDFDADEYLEALAQVPVFSREHVRNNMLFLRNMINVLAEMGLGNLELARKTKEQKQMKDALEVRELQFRTLAENTPDNIARYDRQGRVMYTNPRLEQLLGRSSDELLGKFIGRETFPDVNFDSYRQKLLDVAANGENAVFEQIFPGDNGSQTHLIHMVAERNLNNDIVGVLAIGRDITEIREFQNQLQQMAGMRATDEVTLCAVRPQRLSQRQAAHDVARANLHRSVNAEGSFHRSVNSGA